MSTHGGLFTSKTKYAAAWRSVKHIANVEHAIHTTVLRMSFKQAL